MCPFHLILLFVNTLHPEWVYWIPCLISITRSEIRACLNPHVAASGWGQQEVLGDANSKRVFILQDKSQ